MDLMMIKRRCTGSVSESSLAGEDDEDVTSVDTFLAFQVGGWRRVNMNVFGKWCTVCGGWTEPRPPAQGNTQFYEGSSDRRYLSGTAHAVSYVQGM